MVITPLFRLVSGLALGLCLAMGPGGTAPAAAQGLFDPVAKVNDGVVTRFELAQRLRFVTALRQPGMTPDKVLDTLIDERLELAAAKTAGTIPSEDDIQQAMSQFASRANMTTEQFVQAIGQAQIAPETFHDFIRAQLAWRNLVQTKFGPQARISDAELTRALALAGNRGNVEILLSEVILPLDDEHAQMSEQLASQIEQLKSEADFSAAARDYSVANTAANGGKLDWMPISKLPAQIAPLFLTMHPGEVAPAVPLNGAIGIFQMRGLRDATPPKDTNVALDYMTVAVPAGTAAAEIARIRPQVQACESLYGIFKGAAAKQITKSSTPRKEIDGSIAAVLDTLDPNEMAPLPGGNAFVMLCQRSALLGPDVSQDDLRQRLFVQKITDLADGYLASLRADAYIDKIKE